MNTSLKINYTNKSELSDKNLWREILLLKVRHWMSFTKIKYIYLNKFLPVQQELAGLMWSIWCSDKAEGNILKTKS